MTSTRSANAIGLPVPTLRLASVPELEGNRLHVQRMVFGGGGPRPERGASWLNLSATGDPAEYEALAEQYAALLHQATPKPDTGAAATFAHQLRRSAMYGGDALSRITAHMLMRAPRLTDRDDDQRRKDLLPARASGGAGVEPLSAWRPKHPLASFRNPKHGVAALCADLQSLSAAMKRGGGEEAPARNAAAHRPQPARAGGGPVASPPGRRKSAEERGAAIHADLEALHARLKQEDAARVLASGAAPA